MTYGVIEIFKDVIYQMAEEEHSPYAKNKTKVDSYAKEKPPVKIMVPTTNKIQTRRFSMNQIELSRVNEFRQLKKQIQGSGNHLMLGIDVRLGGHP